MKEINKELKETLEKELQLGKDFGIFGDLNIKIQDDKVVVGSKFDMGDVINELVIVALIDFLEYNKDMLDIQIDNLDITLKLFEKIIKNKKKR